MNSLESRRQPVAARHPWILELAGSELGQFTLERPLGAGTVGAVYSAFRRQLTAHRVAIKVVPGNPQPGWETELQKVFRLALVDGVVKFHDLDVGMVRTPSAGDQLVHYTVWDYIPPGRDLATYLKTEIITASFMVAVIDELLQVLHLCRANGVEAHGDLHAGNVLLGESSGARLGPDGHPRAPIYVSDFGMVGTAPTADGRAGGADADDGGSTGATGDHGGLLEITNLLLVRVDKIKTTPTDRHLIKEVQDRFRRLLQEANEAERRPFGELLEVLREIKREALSAGTLAVGSAPGATSRLRRATSGRHLAVGQFQVSEMIGERWEWWRDLFVPDVPAQSRILIPDIPTVVTGPRGCGKTMLFRRLSERLMLECGPVPEMGDDRDFVAFYINANDFSDAFAHFPERPSPHDERHLIAYANLCVLSDLLVVVSARLAKAEQARAARERPAHGRDSAGGGPASGDGARGGAPDWRADDVPSADEEVPPKLLEAVREWLIEPGAAALLTGEGALEAYRTALDQIKWRFPRDPSSVAFPGFAEMSHHGWLPRLIALARAQFHWVADRTVLLFVDDFSTPRVSTSMQRVLNRLFLQRSPMFVSKVATEAGTTFVTEDSSGKQLQDGEDYQMVDLGSEALFMTEDARQSFLNAVLSRRLKWDSRVPAEGQSLSGLLGRHPLSKTEFARQLRTDSHDTNRPPVTATQRRGASRQKVWYHGEDVFGALWSGDTRNMIQLVNEMIDRMHPRSSTARQIPVAIDPELQNSVLRERGGEWLRSHTRNAASNPLAAESEWKALRADDPTFDYTGGSYGAHLMAIVEAFASAARSLLLAKPYRIEGRDVPRMAFRIEILDEFRLDGLASEIYQDLIRYGLFMRDDRGKSVRGAFVPRLYLRRLLLPFCYLALSKRDSVPLTCADFHLLLLYPDRFRQQFDLRRSGRPEQPGQPSLFGPETVASDPDYNDVADEAVDGTPADEPGAADEADRHTRGTDAEPHSGVTPAGQVGEGRADVPRRAGEEGGS